MMEAWLIAHKVRGEPALDIATKMEVGDEHWWIIPTSGHRAYPYWWVLLTDLDVPEMPIGTRDHYATADTLKVQQSQGQQPQGLITHLELDL